MPGEEKSSHSSGDGLPVLQDNQNGDKYWTAERYEMWVAYGYLYNAIANNPSPFGIPSGNADNAINEIIKKVMSPDLTENGVYSFFGLIKNDAGELVDDGSGKGADLGNRISTCEDIMRVRGMVGSIEYDRSKPDRNGLKGFTGHHFNELIGFARKVSKSGQMLSNSEFKDYAEAKSKKELGKYYTKIKDLIEGWDQPLTGESGEDGKLVQELEKEQKELSTLKRSISTSRRESARQVVPTTLSLAGFGGGVAGLLTGGGGILSGLVGIGSLASPFGIFVVGAGLTFGGFTALKHFGGKLISQFSKTGELKRQLRDLKKGKYAQASIELKGAIAAKHFIESKDGKFKSTQEKKDFLRACRECVNFQGIGIDELKSERNKFRKSNNLKTFVDNIQAPAKFMNAYDTTSSASMLNSYPGLIENAKTLEEIRGLYQGLKNNYDSEKDGDTKRALHDIMEKGSEKIIDIFQDTIFDNAYTSSTADDAETALHEPLLNEAVKNGTLGDNLSNIQNAIKFARSSQSKLNDELGVSIQNQLKLTKQSIENGVLQTGMLQTDPEFATVQTIAGNIQNMTTQSQYDAVTTQIATITNAKAKKYLEFVAGKKGSGCTYDVAKLTDMGVESSFISDIESLKNYTDYTQIENESDSIRKAIMGSTLSPDKKDKAIRALNSQVQALEEKQSNEIYSSMVDNIKNNTYDHFEEQMKKIDDLGVGKINPDELSELYSNFVTTVQPKKVCEFLLLKLSDKVTKNLNSEINGSKYSGNGDDVIKNITTLLMTIETLSKNHIIKPSQKQQLINKLSKNIKDAIENKITLVQQEFAVEGKYESKVFVDIIKKSYSAGGFAEYFDMKTPESEKLKKAVEEMQNVGSVIDMLKVTVTGTGKMLKESNEEALAFSQIYFKDFGLGTYRGIGDRLYNSIVKTQKLPGNFSNNINGYSDLVEGAGGYSFEGLQAIIDTRAELNYIINNITDPEDKFAALLVLKKRCIGMYKIHADAYFRKKGKISYSDRQTYLSNPSNSTEFKTQVYENWIHDGIGTPNKGIMTNIDEQLDTLRSGGLRYRYTTGKESLDKSLSELTINEYLGSEME